MTLHESLRVMALHLLTLRLRTLAKKPWGFNPLNQLVVMVTKKQWLNPDSIPIPY